MTCKDCYHYVACKEKFAGLYKICVDKPKKHLELNPQVEKRCQHFKDKSRIIEVPCKIGDRVYRPSKCLGVVQFIITSLNIYQSELFFTDDSENIIYLPEIGKTVFLTKEEAEAKLKELNNER